MTTATNGSSPPGAPAPAPVRAMPTPPRIAPVKRRRRPGLMALGIALVAVGALTAAWLVSVQGQHTAVLVLARDVPYGSVITDSDLTTAEVSVDPSVATIPAGDRESVVGSVAATTLTSGALLARNQLTVAAPPADGQVLVGLALAATRMPAGGLEPGDRILVVDTPNPDADPSAIPPSTIAATVVRLGSMDVNGVTVVDVTVASGDGPALAARSATGRVAVVLQPRAG